MLRSKLASSIAFARKQCRTKDPQQCKIAWDEVEDMSRALAKKNRRMVQERKEAELSYRARFTDAALSVSNESFGEYFPDMDK